MATKTDQHVCELSKQLKRLLAENTSLILDKDKEKVCFKHFLLFLHDTDVNFSFKQYF